LDISDIAINENTIGGSLSWIVYYSLIPWHRSMMHPKLIFTAWHIVTVHQNLT